MKHLFRASRIAHQLKRAAENKLYPISESVEDVDYPANRDYFDVLNEVERIFRQEGIRISSDEQFHEACIDSSGKVLGASVVAISHHDQPTVKFSVAVDSAAQRQGIATRLVQSIMAEFSGQFQLEAWVVNPNMGALLDKLGFSEPHGGWSPDNPYYTLP